MQSKLNLEFVLIPAGEFVIGSNAAIDRLAGIDEQPQHRLAVSDFYMARYLATNAQYLMFLEATGHRRPRYWAAGHYPENAADHPVTDVSFHDAAVFCRWASEITGLPLRLPTETEWEKAARGPDGRIYPWGNEWTPGLSNTADSGLNGTSPVTQFSPQGDSPYGVADMAGNVQSWCSSLFDSYPYDPNDGRERLVYAADHASLLPSFRETGAIANAERFEANAGKQTLRGGSWRGHRQEARCAYRSWAAPMHRSDDTGFRCCYEL